CISRLGLKKLSLLIYYYPAAILNNAQVFGNRIASGELIIPPPSQDLEDWPFIGVFLQRVWQKASVNLGDLLSQFKPQLEELSKYLLLLVKNTGLTLLESIFSIIIAPLLMINARNINQGLILIAGRLSPVRGKEFMHLAIATIRNITRGVIGVSALQALLIGVGLIIAGMPGAGLLTLLVLVLCIIQIGPGLVVLGSLFWAWSSLGQLTAFLFTLWMIPAGLIDNILKPIVMAQGLPVPIIIILMGVIGGTLTQGILGLFIGPVVLILGYELVKTWVTERPAALPSVAADDPQP
ncbi:MAG: AI-2E family transporter, partial [Gloeomargaritaceae cyanobacterium C42_A2020_066]|nr:AI-2E family transporter [Gloeomargaritaceae cyanobacterium C42_A2020_066]